MPNWVANRINITAIDKADLDLFVEKAKGKDSKILDGESDFHFGAFIHPKDEELENYKDKGWYDWNVENWGTKWDASSSDVERTSDLSLGIGFETPWGIPEPLFRAVVEQHPELSFLFWSEEEQGWGAEFAGENGSLVLTNEWDIPDSHADYVSRDNVDGCICAYDDDRENWYDDCPGKQKIFVRVTRVYELESANNLEEARTLFFQMENGDTPLPEPENDYGSVEFVDEDGNPYREEN
jgi:hypothetical protein